MPALEHGSSQHDTSSSHTFLGTESLIKQYHEGKIGPQTGGGGGGGGVIIIRKPDEAFGGYVRDRERSDSSANEEQRHYVPATPPHAQQRLVTALDYDHDDRVSSLRGYVSPYSTDRFG